MQYYTYLWLREDGTPYYVGKGKGNRAFTRHRRCKNLVPPPVERILIQEFPNEDSAFTAEVFLIAFYGRKDCGTGILRNLSNGGEGFRGIIRTAEHNKKIGDARHRHYVAHGISQATRQLWSDLRKGRPAHNKGVPISEEQKSKLRLKIVSDATRARLSEARRRRPPISEGTRHKVSESMKLFWQNKRKGVSNVEHCGGL